MLTRLAVLGAVVASLTLAPVAQAAPFIVGGMSLSSIGVGPGLSPLVPVASSGATLDSYTGATALDFTTTGAATPGVDGGFRVDGTSGDFNVLNGLGGTIKDFTFAGLSKPNYPAPPIVGFEIMTSPVFSFDLLTITVEDQSRNILTLSGTGLFHLTGYESTMGTFYFSANEAGSGNTNGATFSFSASEATTRTSVPEPVSLLLFGLGLIGLSTIRRRTMR